MQPFRPDAVKDLVLKLMGDEDEFVRMHAVKTLDALICSDITELIPIIVQKFVSAELKDSVKQGMARVLNLKLPEFEDEILEALAKSKLSPDTLTQLCKQWKGIRIIFDFELSQKYNQETGANWDALRLVK